MASFHDPYKPTGEDLDWAKWITNSTRDGGLWVFLATGMMFRFDHVRKTVTLQNREMRFLNEVNAMMYRRTEIVFKAIGYEVK